MMAVDGVAAARTMKAFGTCRPGYCLYYVWQAYKAHGASTNHSAPTAYEGWKVSGGKHEDRNPPAGVPVWFGPKVGSSAGDVVISLGDGRVVATDWPSNGVINETTIDARQRQINRPYLGWTETILDYPISFNQTAGGGSTPAPEPLLEVFDMSNPIINVIDRVGGLTENGTLFIGMDDGTFIQYEEALRQAGLKPHDNVRNIFSMGLLFGKPIPNIIQKDFEAIKFAWATMCRGGRPVDVWSHPLPKQNPDGTPAPGVATAQGFMASTNAQVAAIRTAAKG